MGGDVNCTNYILCCDSCKADLNSREEWYDHLTGNGLQLEARLGIRRWMERQREAVLVVFWSAPMDKEGGKLLRWMAGGDLRVVVADFVWWTDRPRVAFVRFESSDMVEKVLERCLGQCGGNQVHLRKASEFLEVEWTAFLPEYRHPLNLEGSDPELCFEEARASPAPAAPVAVKDLSSQFKAIWKSVKVPVNEWTYLQKLLEYLNRKGRSFVPQFQVHAFRHSYLKLRLPDCSNNWLLHVSCNGVPFPADKMEGLLKKVTNYGKVEKVMDDKDDSSSKMGAEFREETDFYSVNFTLVTFERSIVEAQLSRLTKYLLGFDPRCIPLLGLVYYWCTTNNLRVCLEEGAVKRNHSPTCVPGPAALEWMVISFLGGNAKLIPTAGMILSHPHKPIYLLKDNRLDVGFDCDLRFCNEWKRNARKNVPEEGSNEFYLSVVELAQEFFQFYGQLLQSGNWILNTRDGEMVPTQMIVKTDDKQEPDPNGEGTMLSEEEVKLVRKAKRRGSHKVKFNEIALYIIHPLHLVCDLRLDNEQVSKMQRLMEATGIRLQNWIECQREKGQKVDLATVLKIGDPEVFAL